jgi:hypothetical protein
MKLLTPLEKNYIHCAKFTTGPMERPEHNRLRTSNFLTERKIKMAGQEEGSLKGGEPKKKKAKKKAAPKKAAKKKAAKKK